MESVVCFHFGGKVEDIMEHTKFQVLFVYTFSQLEDHCVKWAYTS